MFALAGSIPARDLETYCVQGILTSLLLGLMTCKNHARSVGYLTFLGYHAETPIQPYVPTLASELKRVVFAAIYDTDKMYLVLFFFPRYRSHSLHLLTHRRINSLSSFTSRPPLLAKAFTTTPLPLDLESDDLFGPKGSLQFIAANTLDERGWSRRSILSGSTCYRARGTLKRFQDDILAIALGSNNEDGISVMTLLSVYLHVSLFLPGFWN